MIQVQDIKTQAREVEMQMRRLMVDKAKAAPQAMVEEWEAIVRLAELTARLAIACEAIVEELQGRE